jgi:hypothetical protein
MGRKKKTDEPAPETEQPAKNPHAQALGKLGGLKGGKARAAKLTPEQQAPTEESKTPILDSIMTNIVRDESAGPDINAWAERLLRGESYTLPDPPETATPTHAVGTRP